MGAYFLDGYGGIYPYAGAGSILGSQPPSFPGNNIARDFQLCPFDDTSGYLLDGNGGIWPIGNAPAVPPAYRPYFGFDIARSIAVRGDCQSGYLLDGYGGIHPFAANGVLPPARSAGYWPGQDIARVIVLLVASDDTSGYQLNGYGTVTPFGAATAMTNVPSYTSDIARGMVLSRTSNPCCSGYQLDGYGGVHAMGPNATNPTTGAYWLGTDRARGLSFRQGYLNDSLDRAFGYYIELFEGMNTWSANVDCSSGICPI